LFRRLVWLDAEVDKIHQDNHGQDWVEDVDAAQQSVVESAPRQTETMLAICAREQY
jgi:hypothetical protein